ncbi:NINE protein [Roseofilum sp. BLCC_M143]|uniref:NINE protein n=1 Tax=Roseofilum casamattae BLCC-M143 TaxID=3022442 RepID=A0ABT7BRT6_9CYAN|nr:NINE protein [Roseofilum casamattae BLCC-M143]
MLSKQRSRKVGIVLASAGALIPIAGFHKFYLGQPRWGLVYLLLSWTPIPHVASAIEAVWYLVQDDEEFQEHVHDSEFSIPGVKLPDMPDINIPDLKLPDIPWEQFWPRKKAGASEPISDRVENVAEALRQLEQLRQEGLISEYEFEQKRRALLDKIG